jgi:hypothetical protein
MHDGTEQIVPSKANLLKQNQFILALQWRKAASTKEKLCSIDLHPVLFFVVDAERRCCFVVPTQYCDCLDCSRKTFGIQHGMSAGTPVAKARYSITSRR